MPKKPIEMERIILSDGWVFKSQTGSHRHYTHPTKSGKVTIPFHSKELLARIRAMTRTQTAQADSKLQIGNGTLDRATFELSTPAGSFRLANKEFQMLELMMSNPSHLISAERFMEKIWGYDSEAEVNVVWVYISYLRKKLTALHANIQIKATRNVGYSLEEVK